MPGGRILDEKSLETQAMLEVFGNLSSCKQTIWKSADAGNPVIGSVTSSISKISVSCS